jgi:hypothetical protein
MPITPMGVSLVITLQPEDVEVLETIRDQHGYNLDQTGIIAHILNEYEMKTAGSLNTKVQA